MTEPALPQDTAPTLTTKTKKPLIIAVVAATLIVGGIAGGAIGAGITASQMQPQIDAAQGEIDDLSTDLLVAQADVETAQSRRDEAEAVAEKLTASVDPVVLKIDFPMPSGYPVLADISSVPDHMRRALDTGTGQVVAVAPGLWASYPPGATVESAVNALAFDGYCASKKAFEAQYLGGETTSGSCW